MTSIVRTGWIVLDRRGRIVPARRGISAIAPAVADALMRAVPAYDDGDG